MYVAPVGMRATVNPFVKVMTFAPNACRNDCVARTLLSLSSSLKRNSSEGRLPFVRAVRSSISTSDVFSIDQPHPTGTAAREVLGREADCKGAVNDLCVAVASDVDQLAFVGNDLDADCHRGRIRQCVVTADDDRHQPRFIRGEAGQRRAMINIAGTNRQSVHQPLPTVMYC